MPCDGTITIGKATTLLDAWLMEFRCAGTKGAVVLRRTFEFYHTPVTDSERVMVSSGLYSRLDHVP